MSLSGLLDRFGLTAKEGSSGEQSGTHQRDGGRLWSSGGEGLVNDAGFCIGHASGEQEDVFLDIEIAERSSEHDIIRPAAASAKASTATLDRSKAYLFAAAEYTFRHRGDCFSSKRAIKVKPDIAERGW